MRATLPLVVACTVGCGAAPAPPPVAARYPASRFVVFEGHGDTASSAEQQARAGVSAAVRSSLTATLQVDITEAGADAHQRVVTETGFDRAELIRVVDADCDRGRCVALAVLSRDEAADALALDYERVAPRFREAAGSAHARSSDDLPGFTHDLRTAEGAFAVLGPLAYQIEAVARRAYGPATGDRDRMTGLEGQRGQRLAALRVTVDRAALDDDALADRLQGALVGALAGLGLDASPSDTCDGAWHLVPTAQVACDRSALGPRCRLDLNAVMSPCAGEAVATVEFGSARLVAVRPRAEADARAAQADRLTAEALQPTLAAGLRSAVPIP